MNFTGQRYPGELQGLMWAWAMGYDVSERLAELVGEVES